MAKFLTVIHAKKLDQVLKNVEYSRDADGVFLINHSISCEALVDISEQVFERFPDLWIGLNRLGIKAEDTFRGLPACVKAIWADESFVNSSWVSKKHIDIEAGDFGQAVDLDRSRKDWPGLYFGGVAFKYQMPVKDRDLSIVSIAACSFVDVITTSGPGTGKAPSVRKISRMKNAIGKFPLAVASGMTSKNISGYLPFVDYFLVSTGVSDSFEYLNPSLVSEFAAKVSCI